MAINGLEPFPEETTSPSSPFARRVPFAENWDKYELLGFLGKGGMGLVYRARDRRLGRVVAIKFVLEASAKMAARLLCEARAQSRIDHPNICRVYEVGEVSGHAYIALQLVQGEPLQHVARRLSLDEKIAVMRDVVTAIHEAHRLGVVHRDLKPSNVLVERDLNGKWFPIVIDFGLARELPSDPYTPDPDSEFVHGTPAYMSPEQARGDAGAVDRRSDIYSLGATLYELVTGQAPFACSSATKTVLRLLSEEPVSPRSLTADLPRDLETVILQCLAKDPARRYPSARALADDLERYLDGEPISGHRHSAWRLGRSIVRHHPVLASVGACVLVFTLVTAMLGAHARDSLREAQGLADKRACLIRQVSEEIGALAGSLREAYLRPLHDVRPDLHRVREGLRAIETSLRQPGSPDKAYVHVALGRGHLALREWDAAIGEFQVAQFTGSDTPESHAELGQALGEMYLSALGRIGQPTDEKDATTWRAERRADLVRRYLDPARRELTLSGDKSRLSRIRIALYSRDFAAAEQQAHEVTADDPDSLEARKIAGEAAFLTATDAFDRGDYDRALPALERASAAFAAALLGARSDGALYRSAAETALLTAEIEYRRRGDPLTALQHALDLIDHGALVADPDDAPAYVVRAYVLLRWYRSELPPPTDEAAMLDRIVESAARAVTLDAKDVRTLVALGIAYIYRGSHEFFHGGQGVSWWHLATTRLEEALAISPDDPRAHNALGLAHRWLGDDLVKTGRDPSPEYELARKSFSRALALAPGYFRACINQAELSTLRAEYDEAIGRDPLSAVEAARKAGRQCLAADLTSYAALDVLARAEIALAAYHLKTGGDPMPALVGARDLLVRSAASLPDHTEVWFQRGAAARIEAAYLERRNGDPTEVITRGRLDLQRALRQMPNCARAHVELARLDLLEERHARSVKASGAAAAALDTARQSAERAVEIDGRLPWGHLTAAEVYLRIAAEGGGRVLAERGIIYADEARRLFPGLPGGQDVREALERLRK